MNRHSMRAWATGFCLGAAVAASAADAPSPPAGEALAAIERLGRARPADAADAAERLLASMPPHSAERLDTLTVLGLELAGARRSAAARRLATGLDDDWIATPQAGAAAAAALLVRAAVEVQDGNLQTADAFLSDARTRLPSDATARSRLRLLAAHARVNQEAGRLEPAMRLYQEALELADALTAPEWQVDMRCGLARLYLLANQPERAQTLSREALALAVDAGDDYALYRAHSTDGVLRNAAGDRDGMRRAFETALDDARRAKAASAESLTLSNLSDFYLKAGDYRAAYALAQRALPLTRALGDKDGQTVALFNAGVALIAMHRLDAGKRAVHESIAIDERRGAFSSMAISYEELGGYLERAGDAAGAVQAFQRSRALYDDIVWRDQQSALVELQARFDAERRGHDLAALNRENLVKGEELHRQALQQQLWWVLAATFVLSLGVLLALYRRVRRANAQLAAGNRELAAQGARDPLTGLANRRHVYGTGGQPVRIDGAAVLLLDVDHFKSINDGYGHTAGDAVLVEIARRLVDAAGDAALIVRWGGEEFLIVVPELEQDAADALAGGLLAALAETPVMVDGRAICIAVSIGYAAFAAAAPDAAALSAERAVRLVDGALYRAKAEGRNCACGIVRTDAVRGAAGDDAAAALAEALRGGRAEVTMQRGPAVARLAA